MLSQTITLPIEEVSLVVLSMENWEEPQLLKSG
jgi:hypothetical protein